MFLSSASKGRCSHVMKKNRQWHCHIFSHHVFHLSIFFSTFYWIRLAWIRVPVTHIFPVGLLWSSSFGWWLAFTSEWATLLNRWKLQITTEKFKRYHFSRMIWIIMLCDMFFVVFFQNYFCFQDVDKFSYHRKNTLLYDLHWFTVSPILYLLVLLYAQYIYIICIEIYMHICTVHAHVHWCHGGFQDNL